MKVKTSKTSVKAARMFTDREEPRAAFWKKYHAVEAELQQESNVHVLNYYGIGGIGKSSLLKKLMSEMDEKLSFPRYIYIDLSNGQESRAVLDKMRNMLADAYQFSFPLFEVGSYVYAKKVGDKVSPLEVQALTKKSPLLSLMMSIAGSIPVLGIAPKVLSLADQSVAMLRSHLKKHSRELKQIEVLEAEELYKKLPSLFAMDLSHNLETPEEPLVVFLDTYETLVNELSSIGEPLKADDWIRGEEGLVQNVPHTLWVISGREKLKWERFDLEWKEAIESHLLGNLSQSDSKRFLTHAGITDSTLCDRLYDLTNGTPVYLDLCVDQFFRIQDEGLVPDISMFGKDTFDLIERFIRYMGDAQQDLVYMFACLDKWDDELIADIAASTLPNFSWTAYEKAKDYSFVILSADGMYNIHQTVGSVLRSRCPEGIKKSVHNSLVKKFAKTLQEQGELSTDFTTALLYIAQAALLCKNRDELRSFYTETVHSPLIRVFEAGLFQVAKNIFDMLWGIIEQDKSDLLYACAVCDKGRFSLAVGDYNAAKQLGKTALNLYTRILGEDHAETLSVMNRQAATLCMIGESVEAIPLLQTVLEKQKILLGDDHPNTIDTMNNFALALHAASKYSQSLELLQTVLEKSAASLGENHPNTISAMHNLAGTLDAAGEHRKSLELLQTVFEKRIALLGENHPDTIDTMNNLAGSLYAVGEYSKSLERFQTVLEKRTALLGENHPNTISAMSNLAVTLSGLDKHEEAFELNQLVLEKRIALLGENHPDTISAMGNLAVTLSDLDKREEAVELNQLVLKKSTALLGENHPNTILAMNNLAATLYALGIYNEAHELFQAVLAKRLMLLGEDHPDTIAAIKNLASIERMIDITGNNN